MPLGLRSLHCNDNELRTLPPLQQLRELYVRDNWLYQLGELPTGLITLDCDGNLLERLPLLPPTLMVLYARVAERLPSGVGRYMGVVNDVPPTGMCIPTCAVRETAAAWEMVVRRQHVMHRTAVVAALPCAAALYV